MSRKLTFWVRLSTAYPELYLLWDGERRGFDDLYLGTYWTADEARAAGERVLAAAPGSTVDLGHGYTFVRP